jgi:prolyl oligopeptidase
MATAACGTAMPRTDAKWRRATGIAVDYPATPVVDVRENYHGSVLIDSYRWLEDTSDPAVMAWFRAQGELARNALGAIPHRQYVRSRIDAYTAVEATASNLAIRGDLVFYKKQVSSARGEVLIVRDGFDGVERVLVDPNQDVDTDARSIDYLVPSPDGTYVAYGTSVVGSEDSTLQVVSTSSGIHSSEAIPHTQYAALSWHPNGAEFFYWRTEHRPDVNRADGHAPMAVYNHVVGRDHNLDKPVFGRGLVSDVDLHPMDHPSVVVSPLSPEYAIGTVFSGRPEYTAYVARLADMKGGEVPAWRKLFGAEDGIVDFDLKGRYLYALSHSGAQNLKVLRIDLAEGDLTSATTLLAERRDGALKRICAADDALYVTVRSSGFDRVLRVSYDGKTADIVSDERAHVSHVIQPNKRNDVFFVETDWNRFPEVVRYDTKTLQRHTTNILERRDPPTVVVTKRTLAKSRDGEEVPLTILHREGLVLDGTNPTRLEGYGAYGLTLTPRVLTHERAWLEQGGVLAIAHVRGGGAKGNRWRESGKRRLKQNSVDDLIACAEHLIEHRYTSPDHLAVAGTSAGGVLVGAAVTQRPELFSAALVRAGVLNILRFEQMASAHMNTPEFGTVADEDDFRVLRAIDAYENVQPNVKYPAVLVTAGLHDLRLPVWQAGKFIAKLQSVKVDSGTALLRLDDTGHGLASADSEFEANSRTDEFLFLWEHLSARPLDTRIGRNSEHGRRGRVVRKQGKR